MIDFRYHLVSLISVFMALAVGIVLGAGPLKEAIGDALTGEVEELRTRSSDLRSQLEESQTDLAQTEEALTAVAPGLLDGVLTGRRVAIIELADVTPQVHESVVARLGEAGATVTVTAEIRDVWTDPAQSSFRSSLAGSLRDYLDPVPADDASTETELAESLVQALTGADPTDADLLGEEGGLALQVLVDAELVSLDAVPTAPADAVVVLSGPTTSLEEIQETEDDQESADPEAAAADEELREARIAAGLTIARAAQARSTGAVVAGGELTEPSLVRTIRQDRDASRSLTTVDSVHNLAGQIAVAMALGARIDGTVGHYGTGAGAGALMPPHVQLEEPVRTEGDGTTGTTGGGTGAGDEG